jgi:hypothetical protein
MSKARTYFSKLFRKLILILEYSYLNSLKPAYPWSLFFLSGKSCGVQSSTQGLLTPLQVLTGAAN